MNHKMMLKKEISDLLVDFKKIEDDIKDNDFKKNIEILKSIILKTLKNNSSTIDELKEAKELTTFIIEESKEHIELSNIFLI